MSWCWRETQREKWQLQDQVYRQWSLSKEPIKIIKTSFIRKNKTVYYESWTRRCNLRLRRAEQGNSIHRTTCTHVDQVKIMNL